MTTLATTELNVIEWHTDYIVSAEALDSAEQDAIRWHRTMASAVKVFGEILTRQKDSLKHGAFQAYCEYRLGLSSQKVSEYMRAYKTLKRADAGVLEASSSRALAKLADASDQQFAQAVEIAQQKGKISVEAVNAIVGNKVTTVPSQAIIDREVESQIRERDTQKMFADVGELEYQVFMNLTCNKLVREFGHSPDEYFPEWTHSWQGNAPDMWRTLEAHSQESMREIDYLWRKANDSLKSLGRKTLPHYDFLNELIPAIAEIATEFNNWLAAKRPALDSGLTIKWAINQDLARFVVKPDFWFDAWWRILAFEEMPETMPEGMDFTVIPQYVKDTIWEGQDEARAWRKAQSA